MGSIEDNITKAIKELASKKNIVKVYHEIEDPVKRGQFLANLMPSLQGISGKERKEQLDLNNFICNLPNIKDLWGIIEEQGKMLGVYSKLLTDNGIVHDVYDYKFNKVFDDVVEGDEVEDLDDRNNGGEEEDDGLSDMVDNL